MAKSKEERKAHARKYYQDHREARLAYQSDYSKRDEVRKKRNTYMKKYRQQQVTG